MKAITFILFFILSISMLFSQPISQEWAKRFNGTSNSLDYSYALTLDNSGNLIVTGFATYTASSKDMQTIKYDPAGNILWAKNYDGSNHGGDYSFAVVTDAAGNVYITGRSDSGPTSADITTIKYDANGTQQWASLYDGPAHLFDEARSLVIDNLGNVYVAGRCMTVSSDEDIVLIKYNSTGVQQWVKTYNGTANGYDAAYSVVLDQNNNIILTGESLGSGADYMTIKYNSSGVQLWANRYNGTGNGGDVAISVKVDGNSNVYVTGQSDGGVSRHDFATIKYDAAGNEVWVKRFNNSFNSMDLATGMAVSPAGNVYVTGTTTTANNDADSNYATIKYNTNGDLLWVANYLGPNNAADVSRAITLDANENVYITGSSFIQPDLDDYATIKYNSDGVTQWIMTYNGPVNSNDYASSIAVNAAGDVFVTGRSNGNGTSFDFATIKYSIPTEITPVSSQVPLGFSLYQNYPNPFNPATKIKFDLPFASAVSLKLFSISGKEISNIFSGNVSPGSYEVSFEASALPSGVYFYKIEAGKYTDTKKMMLIK